MITQAELKNELTYNHDNGLFFWVKSKKGRIINKQAGSFDKNGYLNVMINYKKYSNHRLAWLYVYGNFPKHCIDHINGDTSDNRLCNLREATHSENMRNAKKRKHNTTGFTGVTFDKSCNKFQAKCGAGGKTINLGFYNTALEANKVYQSYAKKVYGEFYSSRI